MARFFPITYNTAPPTPPSVYSTSFDATENPISGFYGGLTDGLLFSDVRSQSGYAYATTTIVNGVNDYEDSLALVKPATLTVTRDHYVEITVRQTGGSSGSHEVEALLAGSADFSFYEILMQRGATTPQFIHQSGALPGFTVLDGTGGTPTPSEIAFLGGLEDGDVMRAEISHDDIAEEATITLYHNDTAWYECVIPYANAYYLDGVLPGIGFYVENGNTPENYCVSHFEAGQL